MRPNPIPGQTNDAWDRRNEQGVLASDLTRVFAKEELLREVWGLHGQAASTRTFDSHASRLRRKSTPSMCATSSTVGGAAIG